MLWIEEKEKVITPKSPTAHHQLASSLVQWQIQVSKRGTSAIYQEVREVASSESVIKSTSARPLSFACQNCRGCRRRQGRRHTQAPSTISDATCPSETNTRKSVIRLLPLSYKSPRRHVPR